MEAHLPHFLLEGQSLGRQHLLHLHLEGQMLDHQGALHFSATCQEQASPKHQPLHHHLEELSLRHHHLHHHLEGPSLKPHLHLEALNLDHQGAHPS